MEDDTRRDAEYAPHMAGHFEQAGREGTRPQGRPHDPGGAAEKQRSSPTWTDIVPDRV
jgi:hypothetical protein